MSSSLDRTISQDASRPRVSNWNARRLLAYVKRPAIGALIVTLSDLIGIMLVTGAIRLTTLVLIMILEGSLGLIGGAGIVLSSTPSISKFGEMTIGTTPWSREGEKNAEKVAGKWIVASSLMILAGFALSII